MNSKKYNIAILGCGKVAHLHAKAIQNIQGSCLAAVWSRTERTATEFARQYGTEAFADIPYDLIKEYYDIPEVYDFSITIENRDYTFLNYGVSNEDANTVSSYQEQIIVFTNTQNYVSANMQIQVFQ